MATIRIGASWFWAHKEDCPGIKCDRCGEPVYGLAWFPILQMGEADKLDFRDIDAIACTSCKELIDEELS